VFKVLLAGALAVAVAVAPGAHNLRTRHRAQISSSLFLVGSSSPDGRRIGAVTGSANYPGQALLMAGIEQPLGIGEHKVGIPPDMFVYHFDWIELTLTAEEIKDRLTEPPPMR
jgi:hypothetical protein